MTGGEYKIPSSAVGPLLINEPALDLIEWKNALLAKLDCQEDASVWDGLNCEFSDTIDQNSASKNPSNPQSVRSIKDSAANLVEAQLWQECGKHCKNLAAGSNTPSVWVKFKKSQKYTQNCQKKLAAAGSNTLSNQPATCLSKVSKSQKYTLKSTKNWREKTLQEETTLFSINP